MMMLRATSSDSDEITSMLDSALSTSSTPIKDTPKYYVQYPPSSTNYGVDGIPSEESTPSLQSPFRDSSCNSTSSSRDSGTTWTWATRTSDLSGWRRFRLIEEEDRPDIYWNDDGCSGICNVLVALMGFATLFWFFCFCIWAVGRHHKPEVSVQSLTMGDYRTSEGIDWTGVPTRFLSLNCSITMLVHNPATFFGIHVTSTPVNLLYYDLVVASGQLLTYYQPRKSWRAMSVRMGGSGVPLYGAAVGLEAAAFTRHGLPMKLNFTVLSRANLMGKLIRAVHHRHVSCSMAINFHNSETFKFEEESCTYN
ncbi:hypothetical protein Dimus_026500 [Dionaea muscipula]